MEKVTTGNEDVDYFQFLQKKGYILSTTTETDEAKVDNEKTIGKNTKREYYVNKDGELYIIENDNKKIITKLWEKAETTQDNIGSSKWTVNGNILTGYTGTIEELLKECDNDENTIVIPNKVQTENGTIVDITEIGTGVQPLFFSTESDLYSQVKQVTKKLIISEKIEKLKSYSFAYISFDKVILPDSVQTIEGGALTSGTIEKVNFIGKTLSFPNSVTIENAIISSSSGSSVIFPGSSSPMVKNIKIMYDGKSEITGMAGSLTSTINTIEIGEGIQELGEYSLAGCSNLSLVKIPNSLTKIGDGAFYNCSNLKSINLKDTKLQSIGERSFCECRNLDNIELPSTLTTIGDGAFYYCSNLKSINLEDIKLQSIGTVTFGNCSILDNIELPSTLTTIEESAFYNCSNLKSINLEDTKLQSIGRGAFANCSILDNIELPSTLTTIGDGAFSNCSELANITINKNEFEEDGITPTISGSPWGAKNTTIIWKGN